MGRFRRKPARDARRLVRALGRRELACDFRHERFTGRLRSAARGPHGRLRAVPGRQQHRGDGRGPQRAAGRRVRAAEPLAEPRADERCDGAGRGVRQPVERAMSRKRPPKPWPSRRASRLRSPRRCSDLCSRRPILAGECAHDAASLRERGSAACEPRGAVARATGADTTGSARSVPGAGFRLGPEFRGRAVAESLGRKLVERERARRGAGGQGARTRRRRDLESLGRNSPACQRVRQRAPAVRSGQFGDLVAWSTRGRGAPSSTNACACLRNSRAGARSIDRTVRRELRERGSRTSGLVDLSRRTEERRSSARCSDGKNSRTARGS